MGHDVFLVRHAPTTWTGKHWCGRADPPLSDEGRRIADDLARTLAPHVGPGTVILSSPSQRARNTADAIAAFGRLPVTIDEDLLEVDVGLAEGLTWALLEERYPETARRLLAGEPADWPGGETAAAVRLRAGRAADRVRAASAGSPIVVVSHGGLLHSLAASLGVGDAPALQPGGIIRISAAAP